MEWETFVLEVYYYVLNRCVWICSGFHNKMPNSKSYSSITRNDYLWLITEFSLFLTHTETHFSVAFLNSSAVAAAVI